MIWPLLFQKEERSVVEESRSVAYRRVAVGVLCNYTTAPFSEAVTKASAGHPITEPQSLLFAALWKHKNGNVASLTAERRVRGLRLERQLWFVLSSELQHAFPEIRAAYETFLDGDLLGNVPAELTTYKALVKDLLLTGHFATIVDCEAKRGETSERSGLLSLLRLTSHIVECVTVSKTNIEAVTRSVGQRGRRAEWFLMVAIVG